MHRIQKLLSNRGHCSRRKAEELIAAGKVRVDGKTVTLGDKAAEDATITVDGKEIKAERRRYLLLNKPKGYVTAVEDRHERTVMELVDIKERIYPVGRLDKDTTGLLLLTNDGDWANGIAHPRHELEKTYEAELDKGIANEKLKRLEKGVDLEDGKTHPAKTARLSHSKIRLTIHEGRNRIVRRMFEALGYDVKELNRSKIGILPLGKLKQGEWRDLEREEIESLRARSG